MSFERKLIEQRSLFDLPMSHHDLQSCQLDRLNSLISLRRNRSRLFQQNRPQGDASASIETLGASAPEFRSSSLRSAAARLPRKGNVALLVVADTRLPCGPHAQTYFNLWLICAGCPLRRAVAGRPRSTNLQPQAGAAFDQAVRPLLRCHLR
jgi:hypothetical protein